MTANSYISEKLYLGTFFVWVMYFSLFLTTLFPRDTEFPNIYKPLLLLIIGLLILKELIDLPRTIRDFRDKPILLIVLAIFAIIMFIRIRNRDTMLDFSVLILTFSARTIPYKKLLCVFSIATFTTLFITVLASNQGIISNVFQKADIGYRFALGFNYVSFAAQRMFFALVTYLMWRDKKVSFIELFGLTLLTFYFYEHTGTTSPYYLSLLILFYAFIAYKIFKKDIVLENRILRFMAKWSYVVGTSILLYLIFYASPDTVRSVDQIIHNRLRLSINGFREFGVSLFGNKISFTTLDIFGNFSANYDYIDSSIIQAMVLDGLLYVMFFAVYGFHRTVQYFIDLRRDIVIVGIAVMVLHGMFDPQLLVLYYSPMLLLISRIFVPDIKEVDGEVQGFNDLDYDGDTGLVHLFK